MQKLEYRQIFTQLKLDLNYVSDNSIYPFAPVFLYNDGKNQAVIKRTKKPPFSKAESLFAWTRVLAGEGIGVVTPDKRFNPNTVKNSDEIWVIYPFVSGSKYSGTKEEIISAGRLLGKIHTCNAEMDFGLHVFTLDSYYDDDFQDDVYSDLESLYKHYAGEERISRAIENRMEKANEFFSNVWPSLPVLQLPYCNGIWDYKANNLIYDSQKNPVLVDPDNAGRIPRLFDLALTLILFHNEHDSAPARIFTVEEWKLFMKGYGEFSTITDIEKDAWQNYIELVYLDEAVWSMQNNMDSIKDEPYKTNSCQCDFIKELLCFKPERYKPE